jgi:hypothetical protein
MPAEALSTMSATLEASLLSWRTLERRAVEAAIWGMPVVSVDAMRQAFFRDAQARYGDILFWSRPADWRLQFPTPNASSRYVYFNFNTRDGPLVLELPAAIGAGLSGSIANAWQVPLADVGQEGEDHGLGGRYLLLPPGHERDVPPGHIPVRPETFNGYVLLRAIPASGAAGDVDKALELVRQVRLYPLALAATPPKTRHIDMSGRLLDGAVRFDDSFFDSLARMVEEEPVHEHDLVAMAQLRSLGIGKDMRFRPDRPTRALLARAAEEVHLGFMGHAMTGERWWPNSQWLLSALVGPQTGFGYATGDRLEVDERGMIFFLGFAAPCKLRAATFRLAAFRDAADEPLRGERRYRLRVPTAVPARQYWAATAYDLETACFIRESPRVCVDSYGKHLERRTDGAVDVFFGPEPPSGHEANWIHTVPGRPWFTFFRLYGPEPALLDRSWVLGDLEEVTA